MTFALVTVGENREKIVGTIWADGESDAQQIATSIFPETAQAPRERLVVRRAEEREIPLRMMN